MKRLYSVFVVVVLIGIAVFLLRGEDAAPPADAGQTYSSTQYGISFEYPDGYVLEGREVGNGNRGRYSIVLIREEDSAIPENGEGPTAISVDIYQNNLDQLSILEWLTGTNDSNFKLSPTGAYASTTVDGVEAVNYRWSGLYEGETTAFLHRDTIIAITVTTLTPQDENVAVYRTLLDSVDLAVLQTDRESSPQQ